MSGKSKKKGDKSEKKELKMYCPFCWKFAVVVDLSGGGSRDLFRCTLCNTVFDLRVITQDYMEF